MSQRYYNIAALNEFFSVFFAGIKLDRMKMSIRKGQEDALDIFPSFDRHPVAGIDLSET